MELAIAMSRDDDDHHQQASSKAIVKKTFSLETYLDFIVSHQIQNLTVDHLNKILSIHGFKKNKNRKQAMEAVCAVTELINPGRSTVKDSSSVLSSAGNKKALVTLTEAIKDLKLLNWQECSITSIRTISPKENFSNTVDIPAAEVAAQLMSLKGNKRCRSPMPALSTSIASSGSGRSKSAGGQTGPSKSGGSKIVSGGGMSSAMVPAFGTKRKVRSRRGSMKKIHLVDKAVTALAATASST